MNYYTTIFSEYLSNERMQEIVSGQSLIRNMVRFEAALAKAQAITGVIPASAAEEIRNVLQKVDMQPSDLSAGTLQHGIPVVSFVSQIREKISAGNRQYFHHGATSQDVMDTAQNMIIRDAIGEFKNKINIITTALIKCREQYGSVVCMARTRGQLAQPVTFGVKLDAWLSPIEGLSKKLSAHENELLRVQLGGPVGTYELEGVVKELAKELGLRPSRSWHAQREVLADFTNWLAMITGVTGKIGADILMVSQSEIGEVEERADGGKSSSMPHKNNPVLSEALVALARLNAGLQSIQLQSVIHAGERDGSALIMEWNVIPQMLVNTATAIDHTITILTGMKVHTDRMKQNVEVFLKKNSK